MATPTASARLRAAGLRVTKQRVAILDVLQDAQPLHEHLTVAAIAQRARPLAGSMSLQTAYDCLDALTEACLLRAIEPAGHPVRYEARVADGHHHLVCRRCGELTDVDDVIGVDACLTPQMTAGFVVDTTEVTFWGLCPACADPSLPTTERSFDA